MKEKYIGKAKAKAKAEEKKRALLSGPHGRGRPGMEKNSAGYPHPPLLLPAEAGRGQPPPGEKIDIRGREPCGGFSPNAVRFSTLTGFTSVQTRKVRRRKEGSAGIMFVNDSCFRRRSEDLSAYAVPDNVWVHEKGPESNRFVNDSCFRRRSEDLSAYAVPDNVWVHEKGPESIRYLHDSCFRRRSEDLSAYAVPDNVWVHKENVTAASNRNVLNPNASNPNAVRSATLTGFATVHDSRTCQRAQLLTTSGYIGTTSGYKKREMI